MPTNLVTNFLQGTLVKGTGVVRVTNSLQSVLVQGTGIVRVTNCLQSVLVSTAVQSNLPNVSIDTCYNGF